MCNSVENAARVAVLKLAKELHESIRGKVSRFTEWDETEESTRAVFIAQAQAMLDKYALLPLENTNACSGCRALTNALNDMDESRRQLIQHRNVLAGLVGASEPEELKEMRAVIDAVTPEDEKGKILAAIDVLMLPIENSTPAVSNAGGAL